MVTSCCSSKFGCTIYWGVAFCSTISLIALQFQQQYILPTDAYLYCDKLLKIDFSFLIVFALVAIIFTKSKARDGFVVFSIFATSGGLLLFSLYILFLVETVTMPKLDDALEILRRRYAVDDNILGYIQRKHKCCGIRNFTDWREIIAVQEQAQSDRNEEEVLRIPPAVVSSCCKSINHCGVRLYRLGPNLLTSAVFNGSQPIPYIHDVDHYVHTKGCYSYIKVHANNVYEAMKMYSCVAFLFVLSIVVTFYYYRKKKMGGLRSPTNWPSPPMAVNSIAYDYRRGIFIAAINPFIKSVIRWIGEPEENSTSSTQEQECRSRNGVILVSSRGGSDGCRDKPVTFIHVT